MEVTVKDIKVIIETLRRNEFKGTDIHNIITVAWGEDKISIRQVQRIMKEFEDNIRPNFERKEGSGRKKDPERIAKVGEVERLMVDNPKLTTREVGELLEMSHQMVFHILRNDLHWKCLSDKWVPHDLTENHKQQRIECCERMLEVFEERNIKRYLVVTDEKYFFDKPIGNEVTRKSWVTPDGDSQQISKRMSVDKSF